MNFSLLGLLLLLSINAYSITPEFPVPCEVKCVEISEKFDSSFIVKIKWEDGKKIKDYYLINPNIANTINFKGSELRDAQIEFYKYNETGTFTIYLKGEEGDISSLPSSFRNSLVSAEKFLALPVVSIKNKKNCELKAYVFNNESKIVSQSIAKVSDYLSEISFKETRVFIDETNYTELNVITETKSILPFAEDMIRKRLKELKEIGLCINN
jgi:hypothetical protein